MCVFERVFPFVLKENFLIISWVFEPYVLTVNCYFHCPFLACGTNRGPINNILPSIS